MLLFKADEILGARSRRRFWELYILHDDADDDDHDHDHPSSRPPEASQNGTSETDGKRPDVVWEHRMTEPVPSRIPLDDNSADQVFLRGSGNLLPETCDLAALLGEALRVLRPGGEYRLHGLGADKPLKGPLTNLPGPAAPVRRALTEFEQAQAVASADSWTCDSRSWAPNHALLLTAFNCGRSCWPAAKPGFRLWQTSHQAIYLGPLAGVMDDFGNAYRRGERVPLNLHDWQTLSNSPIAQQFLLLPPDEGDLRGGCCDS